MVRGREKKLPKNWLGAMVVSAVLCSWVCGAAAETNGTTVVLLADREHGETTTGFQHTLASHLKAYGVTVSVQWVPSVGDVSIADARGYARTAEEDGGRVALVTWCNFSAPDSSVLHMSVPGEGSVLVREIGEDDVGEGGRFDALATVVTGAVEALSLGAQLGVSEEHSALPVMEKLVPAYQRGGVSATLEGAYTPRSLSADEPFTNAGGVALGIFFREHWSLALGYTFRHVTVDEKDSLLVSNGHELGLRGEWMQEWDRFSLSTRLGVVLGVVDWRLEGEDPRTGDSWTWTQDPDLTLGIEAALLVGFRIQPWLRIRTGPGLMYLPINSYYEVGRGGKGWSLLEPWSFQPYWMLAATVTMN